MHARAKPLRYMYRFLRRCETATYALVRATSELNSSDCMDQDQLTNHLRHRIVGLLHVQRLAPGDRLPSIRRTARETGMDHRAVAAAYRVLEEEGLVEVRPASGVYVTGGDSSAAEVVLHATQAWVVEVLVEGWRRDLSRAEAAEVVMAAGAHPLRCALVETVEDTRVALAAELEERLDLEIVAMTPESATPAALGGMDLVVTSVFLSKPGRALARRAGLPCVVAGINKEFAAAVDAILRKGSVVGVVADPAMAERAEAYFSVTALRERIRMRLASEVESLDELERESEEPVLATRAARRALGAEDYHLIPAPPGVLGEPVVREIVRIAAGAILRSRPFAG